MRLSLLACLSLFCIHAAQANGPAPDTVPPGAETATDAAPPPAPKQARPHKRYPGGDLRHCLERKAGADVIRCAERRRK